MSQVGIDAVQIARIEALVARFGRKFLSRVYTKREQEYAHAGRGKQYFERLAARFAAKEALIKAHGKAIPLSLIEVRHSCNGRPIIHCSRIDRKITASLTHTRRLAIACVLIED